MGNGAEVDFYRKSSVDGSLVDRTLDLWYCFVLCEISRFFLSTMTDRMISLFIVGMDWMDDQLSIGVVVSNWPV